MANPEHGQPPTSVLVIEDNEDVASLLEYVLKREGYQSHIARDGDAALQIINAGQPPALVLLDLMIPIYSGYEILKRLRARDGWQDIPVIVLTGSNNEQHLNKARKLGADEYALKPFEPSTLMRQIKALLSVGNS